MSHFMILAAAALAFGGASTPPPAPMLTQVVWVAAPTGEDVAEVYPADAVMTGKSGAVLLDCRVAVEGTLEACAVEIEDPVGLEFGAAAMALAPLFKMATLTRDGAPVAGGRVRVPIMFQMVTDGD